MSPLARLLYIALWCEADKEGRLCWKPKTFKMRYLPGDECSVDALCKELIAAGVVVLYGDGLAYIPGFSKHQHVNPRESASVLPEPEGHAAAPPKRIQKDVREQVMERDGGICVRCGSDDHPQLDHILPQSAGGPHIAENLRVLCRSCNAGRPVQGPGLDADLEKDGFSVGMLRVKFGIDASISDLHPQVGREGKGRNISPPPDGVDATVWQDFLKLRKAKKAPVTDTAIDGIRREANKAGLSLSEALAMCCKRGWQGFDASWVAGQGAGAAQETFV